MIENNTWIAVNDSPIAVIFVHGILSSSEKCWRNTRNGKYWPQLVAEDPEFMGPSVFVSGYTADFASGEFDVYDAVEEVIVRLRSRPAGRSPLAKEKLLFVCHSQGGIVTRQMLCSHSREFGQKKVGVILCGSPAWGSFWGKLAKPFASAVGFRQLEALAWESSSLINLDRDFLRLIKDQTIPALCGMSMVETKGLWGLPKIVPTAAATRYFNEWKRIPKSNHSEIVKPPDTNHLSHLYLRDFARSSGFFAPDFAAGIASDTAGAGKVDSRHEDRAVLPALIATGSVSVAAGQGSGPGVFVNAPVGPTPVSIAQIPAGAMPVGAVPSIALMQTSVGPQWVMLPVGQSAAQLIQAAQPKPRMDELFEVITRPEDVAKALFRTEGVPALVPYELDYVKGREGVPDLQEALQTALAESGGRLLVAGRGGIGKTREIAEIAQAACLKKWKICVARVEGDVRLGALPTLPGELFDSRLLFIIDNLHARTRLNVDQLVRYAERLDAFLKSIDELAPGDVRAIVITRDEPHFQHELELPPQATRWRGFNVFRMPEFTQDGLRTMLKSLADRAKVPIADEDIGTLVEASDRTPETLIINVDLARQKGGPLNRRDWLETEGQSWREKLRDAYARYPAAEQVCNALRLLTAARLPTRTRYVKALAGALGAREALRSIEGLVDVGLLGLRQNLLSLFSAEQLDDPNEDPAVRSQQLARHWDEIVRVLTDAADPPAEWHDDLVELTFSLTRAKLSARAAEVASLAIERGADSARIFLARGAARFLAGSFKSAEEDFSSALARDEKDANSYYLRGVIRQLLGNFGGFMADAERAIALGRGDAAVHALVGMGHYQQGHWAEADKEFTEAINLGQVDSLTFFSRGTTRQQLGDLVGAEADFSSVLEKGLNIDNGLTGLAALERGDMAQVLAAVDAKPDADRAHDALAFGLRGSVRAALGKFADAEADLSRAIDGGFGKLFARLAAAMARTSLPGLDRAKEQMAQVQSLLVEDAALYQVRGNARREQGKWDEAIVDFQIALERGASPGEIYCALGITYCRANRFPEAETELNRAIEHGQTNAMAYSCRGFARLCLDKLKEAEPDLEQAIKRGRADGFIFLWRGLVRQRTGQPVEAEADFSEAIKQGNVEGRTWLLRAAARLDAGQSEKAEQDCEEALRRNADAATAFTLRGGARLNLGRFDEAEADLDRAIELKQDDSLVYRWRGVARSRREKFDEAEADFTAAMKRGDNEGLLFTLRASARVDLGHFAEAEQYCDAALQSGADPIAAYTLRGIARLELEKFPEAEADLDHAIDLGRDDWVVFKWRGRTRMRQEKSTEAEADFNDAMARGDASPQTRYWRGLVRAQLNRHAEAEQDYTTALESAPNESWFLYSRGLARYRLERYAEAEADFTAAIAAGMDDADTLVRRASSRLSQEKWAETEQDLVAAQSKGHDDANLQFMLGLARRGLKQYAATERAFAAALVQAPGEPAYRMEHGVTLLYRGKLAEAERDFDAVLAQQPEDVSARWNRGLARYGQGDSAGAVEDYAAALHGSMESFMLAGRAQALLRLGRIKEAENDCATVVQMGADSPDALGCQAALLLARGDFAGASARYEDARQRAKSSDWHFQLGLSLLLSGRAADALAAYQRGAEELLPGDCQTALSDLDFWLEQFPERVTSPEVQQATSTIRSQLTQQLDLEAQNG